MRTINHGAIHCKQLSRVFIFLFRNTRKQKKNTNKKKQCKKKSMGVKHRKKIFKND